MHGCTDVKFAVIQFSRHCLDRPNWLLPSSYPIWTTFHVTFKYYCIDHKNNILLEARIINIIRFSAVSCYSLPVGSHIFLSTLLANTLSLCSHPLMLEAKCYAHIKQPGSNWKPHNVVQITWSSAASYWPFYLQFLAVTDCGYSIFYSSICVCQVEMHFDSDLRFLTHCVSK